MKKGINSESQVKSIVNKLRSRVEELEKQNEVFRVSENYLSESEDKSMTLVWDMPVGVLIQGEGMEIRLPDFVKIKPLLKKKLRK